MGKLFNTMMLGIILTLTVLIFNSSGIIPTSLFTLVLDPTNWENSDFFLALGLSGLVAGFGAIVIGIGAIIKQDWVARIGIVTSLNTILIAPFLDFYRFVVTQTNALSICTNSPVCSQLNSIGGFGQIAALVLAGPLFLYAFWACVSWIFSPESTG